MATIEQALKDLSIATDQDIILGYRRADRTWSARSDRGPEVVSGPSAAEALEALRVEFLDRAVCSLHGAERRKEEYMETIEALNALAEGASV